MPVNCVPRVGTNLRFRVHPRWILFSPFATTAGEVCPIWPGQPMTAHWGVDDPAKAEGTEEEKRKAFRRAFSELSARINLLLNLPLAKLDRLALKKKLQEIGESGREVTPR